VLPESNDAGPRAAVASQRIADHLREEILVGRLSPGVRILQEDVAAQLGASRLPVREAFRILAAEGLVELKANSGAWVSRMDLGECVFTYRLRERIEPMALAESVPLLSVEIHDRLRRIQDQIEANPEVDRFLVLDREFHRLTYSACYTPQLTSMVDRFWNTTQHYRRAYARITGSERKWVVNYEHRLLIDAITRRDIVDAERCLVGHIRRTRIELSSHPELFHDQNPALSTSTNTSDRHDRSE
jgi:DNA-binding GntR family transcriptional regulator